MTETSKELKAERERDTHEIVMRGIKRIQMNDKVKRDNKLKTQTLI